MEAVPKSEDPQLLDIIIVKMQEDLKNQLSWLNYSFGRCQKLVRQKKDTPDYFYPAIHVGNRKYVNVFPETALRNFSFFNIEDPTTYKELAGGSSMFSAKCSVIFWVNLDLIFGAKKDRDAEHVKIQIMDVLKELRYIDGRFSFTKIFETAENIYQGFSIKEVESQFLMQPYAGFRFEGILHYNKLC